MGSKIVAPIFEDAEAFLKENLRSFCTDGFSSIYKTKPYSENFTAVFFDEEEETHKILGMSDYVRALEMLVDRISNKQLFVGGIRNPIDLTDPCNWDTAVVDAFYQLAFHNDVIYG